ncbi:MAG: hypothetical protein KJZ84_24330 [Bryobacteraceae bacterium]|nr:hypothetical protein [Bryobacteraceae bacterium]
MVSEDTQNTADALFRDPRLFTHELGGLEFYGYSTEFRELLELCREFARVDVVRPPRKAYVFSDPAHGKSSLAKAISIQAASSGGRVVCLDGSVGTTAKDLKDLQQDSGVLAVIDGVPEAAGARSTLLDRFNSLKGSGVLLARREYVRDAGLKPDVLAVEIPHVDGRLVDKLAWLLGLVGEHLRDQGGLSSQEIIDGLRLVPVGALVTLTGVPMGPRISNLGSLATRIGQAIQLRVGLQSEQLLPEAELATIFVEFHSSGPTQPVPGFRLWVEGESDSRMLGLVCQLALRVHGIDLREGMAIVPLGQGRDGGTSKIAEVVVGRHTKRNRDIFLLDSDEPGRHAKEELEVLDQEVLLLDSRIACSRAESDVEIEDFVSLGCLDRFYLAHPHLRPEKEIVRYKPPVSRRLVVDGADKEQFMQWLEANATLDDLENLLFPLCEVRSRFSLRNLPAMREKHTWRKRLTDEVVPHKHFGNRSEHWVCPPAN